MSNFVKNFLILVAVVLVITGIYYYTQPNKDTSPQETQKKEKNTEKITPSWAYAKNPESGVCEIFKSTYDVPAGWEKCDPKDDKDNKKTKENINDKPPIKNIVNDIKEVDNKEKEQKQPEIPKEPIIKEDTNDNNNNSENENNNNDVVKEPNKEENIENDKGEEEDNFSIFYLNDKDNGECSAVYAKQVDEPVTKYNYKYVNVIMTLLSPMPKSLQAEGYYSAISSDVRLNRVWVSKGLATVILNDAFFEPKDQCEEISRKAQIEQTLLQFDDVSKVEFKRMEKENE